jgi:hypothetical protein
MALTKKINDLQLDIDKKMLEYSIFGNVAHDLKLQKIKLLEEYFNHTTKQYDPTTRIGKVQTRLNQILKPTSMFHQFVIGEENRLYEEFFLLHRKEEEQFVDIKHLFKQAETDIIDLISRIECQDRIPIVNRIIYNMQQNVIDAINNLPIVL